MNCNNTIQSKSKFVVAAILGFIITTGSALAGFYIQAGHIMLLLHVGEITTVFGITLGALVFSYQSTAFKPWGVPFGLGIPKEGKTLKIYIKVCKSTSSILLIAACFSFVTGLVNGMQYIDNHNLIAKMFSAALTSFTLSLGVIMAIVMPTKWKLESLLNDL